MERSGTDTRKRRGSCSVRLDEKERAELERRAETLNQSIGAFIRFRCLDSPGERAGRRSDRDREDLRRLLGQVGKIGSNLNQIARRLNQGDTQTRETIEQAIEDLGTVSKAVLEALKGKSDCAG